MLTKKSVIIGFSLFSFSVIICLVILLISGLNLGDSAKANTQSGKAITNITSQPTKSVAIVHKNFNQKAKENLTNKTIYLTFDDGPTKYTESILSTLNKNNIQGTFFVLNYPIINRSKLVKEMNEQGHALGCHGVTHRVSLFYKNKKSPVREMKQCQETLKKKTGFSTHLVRVPYGSYPNLTTSQKKLLDKAGFLMWDWNVDSEDWRFVNKPTKNVVNNVINQVKINEKYHIYDQIILFHDTEITSKAIPKIIKKLDKMGYEFKRLSERDIPVQF